MLRFAGADCARDRAGMIAKTGAFGGARPDDAEGV